MPVSEAQKRANKKWRQNNIEQTRILGKKHVNASRNRWASYNVEVKKWEGFYWIKFRKNNNKVFKEMI